MVLDFVDNRSYLSFQNSGLFHFIVTYRSVSPPPPLAEWRLTVIVLPNGNNTSWSRGKPLLPGDFLLLSSEGGISHPRIGDLMDPVQKYVLKSWHQAFLIKYQLRYFSYFPLSEPGNSHQE